MRNLVVELCEVLPVEIVILILPEIVLARKIGVIKHVYLVLIVVYEVIYIGLILHHKKVNLEPIEVIEIVIKDLDYKEIQMVQKEILLSKNGSNEMGIKVNDFMRKVMVFEDIVVCMSVHL